MFSLVVLAVLSQVAGEEVPRTSLCLTAVLERDGFWFAATGGVLPRASYEKLSDTANELRQTFPDVGSVIVSPAKDVPVEWVEFAIQTFNDVGWRRYAITDGALSEKAKAGPPRDQLAERRAWSDVNLLPLLRSQCDERIKAKGFFEEQPRLKPRPVPRLPSLPPPTSKEAREFGSACDLLKLVPPGDAFVELVDRCGSIGSCAGACVKELSLVRFPAGIGDVAACQEFAAFKKDCPPFNASACRRQFGLSMVRGFVEAAATLPEGRALARCCAPMLAPPSSAAPTSAGDPPITIPSGDADTSVRPHALEINAEVGSSDVDRDAINRYVGARRSAITACYEKALKATPSLKGTVVVRFSVAPNGRAAAVKIAENSLGDEAVASCIKVIMGTWTFPLKPRVAVPVSIPFAFSPPS